MIFHQPNELSREVHWATIINSFQYRPHTEPVTKIYSRTWSSCFNYEERALYFFFSPVSCDPGSDLVKKPRILKSLMLWFESCFLVHCNQNITYLCQSRVRRLDLNRIGTPVEFCTFCWQFCSIEEEKNTAKLDLIYRRIATKL